MGNRLCGPRPQGRLTDAGTHSVIPKHRTSGLRRPRPWKPFGRVRLHGIHAPYLAGLCFGNARNLAGLRTRHDGADPSPFLHSPRRLLGARAPPSLAACRLRLSRAAGHRSLAPASRLPHATHSVSRPPREAPLRALLPLAVGDSLTPSKPPTNGAPPTFLI